ncbi:hypothetical protein SGCZBJ_02985 [Caulobacter zeae]|uniref:Uncharacterized protein n=1 Tax=Caulobacter zeae TaxID=2055137 RepID=A0A2N5DQU5_9CAUL|nr:hypothetical protein [Caulobacter zeae]PLR28427.1 hypothetical protein SGCZBJ_02985 [Caulobacter zeae]
MAKVLAVEICYTEKDATDSKTYWTALGYSLKQSFTPPYADIAIYERKNGEQKQLDEKFGGKQPVMLVFEA